jgi:hypothetical protein
VGAVPLRLDPQDAASALELAHHLDRRAGAIDTVSDKPRAISMCHRARSRQPIWPTSTNLTPADAARVTSAASGTTANKVWILSSV